MLLLCFVCFKKMEIKIYEPKEVLELCKDIVKNKEKYTIQNFNVERLKEIIKNKEKFIELYKRIVELDTTEFNRKYKEEINNLINDVGEKICQ